MSGPVAAILPGGRLHLQHGPIDLVISAEGDVRGAYAAAVRRFGTVLEELVAELPLLRSEVSEVVPEGRVARRMHRAVLRLHDLGFVTPMAAVAGAVADEIRDTMRAAASLRKLVVNNGGDISLHLAPSASATAAIAAPDGARHGTVRLTASDGIRGIATSGQGGRSHSLGIADAVTVLAQTAAEADAAATLIANAVDLPGHPSIRREQANVLSPDSDLGHRMVVTGVGPLAAQEVDLALAHGAKQAERLLQRGTIRGAALLLRGEMRVVGGILRDRIGTGDRVMA